MNKRILSLFLMLLAFAAVSDAAPRTISQMKDAAKRALRGKGIQAKVEAKGEVVQLWSADGVSIMGYREGGYAVVSADDVAPEVLGVSTTVFNGKPNSNMSWWLNAMDEVVSNAAKTGTKLKVITPDPEKYPTRVEPLMTTKWDQEEPYNNLCPIVSGSTRCLTGCVATALAQVLNYHKTPEHGYGSRTIYYPLGDPNGTPVTANFGEHYYDWDNMLDEYVSNYSDAEALAVATLMLDCGVAAKMQYGGPNEGSGAYSDDAAEGMRQYFGFSEARCVHRDNFSDAEWMDMVFNEISTVGPLYYGGDNNSWFNPGGHAFVIHGYREDGMVYVNWGWSGDSDGWYDISLLDPIGYEFSRHQDMILGIIGEPKVYEELTVNLTQAGMLSSQVPEEKIGTLGILKVTGDINSSDIRYLRMLAGRDDRGEKTEGKLTELDLSEANIVAGGQPYLVENGASMTTTANQLPDKAFYQCTNLRKVKLPASITHYGYGAFGGCSRLDNVELPASSSQDFMIEGNLILSKDGTEIIAAWPMNSGEIEIGKTVSTIHDYAFSGCARITKLSLPSSVTQIGRGGFAGCSGLSELRTASRDVPQLTGAGVFDGVRQESCLLYVPSGSKTKYQHAAQWKDFRKENIIEYGTSIKVRNAIRYYGEENPDFGYQIQGDMVDGVPELICEATPSSPAGRYPIVAKPGTITNEVVDYIDGYLIVRKAPLTIRLNPSEYTRSQYDDDPEFTFEYEGFLLSDNASSLDSQPVVTSTAVADSPEGTYELIVTCGTDDCYEITCENGTLIVSGVSAINSVVFVNSQPADIYSIDGKIVRKNATTVEGLPKGIYMINGKKYIVR